MKERFLVHDSSTIAIGNDSATTALPIVSTTFYSIAIDPGVEGKNLGSFTSILDSAITNSPNKKKNPSDSILRQEFHAALTRNNNVVLTQPIDSLICSGKNDPTTTRVFELIVTYPQRSMKIGEMWSDTVSATTCHGKTQLIQQTIRRYQILQFIQREGQLSVNIQRNASMILTSFPSQNVGKLSVSGTGSSIATLYLARDTGVLIESNTESQTQLIVTTSRGTFPFTQKTTTHVSAY